MGVPVMPWEQISGSFTANLYGVFYACKIFKIIELPVPCEVFSVMRFLSARSMSASEVDMVSQIITGDETWVLHFMPKTKQQIWNGDTHNLL